VRIPYTSRVVINEDEYLRLIDQIRINVPEEMRRARQIEADRDVLLKQAQEQAEAMIAKGRETAAGLVAEHAVVAQAEERSREILRLAEEQADGKRQDADAYALEVLERIALQLESFRRTVDNGIQVLHGVDPGGEGPLGEGGLQPRIVGDTPKES
jgi:hypothetical protein